MKRNPHIANLQGGYLFPEITRRKQLFQESHPDAHIVSLGIGDTTQPLVKPVVEAMTSFAQALGTRQGYHGYGDSLGWHMLREAISYRYYDSQFSTEEIAISDGAKCDLGRLQLLFGEGARIAVQDPAYPVYVDASVIMGQAGPNKGDGYEGLIYLPCTPENDFFPDLEPAKEADLLIFCSPNNPTGAVATREQLEKLVAFAHDHKAIILFDVAYVSYLQTPGLPRTIYEIEGAKEVAIEVGSFSKLAGFTGVRLGWSVVPKELHYASGEQVLPDWQRICSTLFNGASSIAQHGGLACLTTGWDALQEQIATYMGNAHLIRTTLEGLGHKAYGATDAPYAWVHYPNRKSWEVFDELLENHHLITTPGRGMGPGGEGFIRMSALGHPQDVQEAMERLKSV